MTNILLVLDNEPETSMDAAVTVADAIVVAVGGRGWLCSPRYVVIKMERSSTHLCT